MHMAYMEPSCKLENSGVSIGLIGMEVSEAVRGVWLRVYKRPKGH